MTVLRENAYPFQVRVQVLQFFQCVHQDRSETQHKLELVFVL